MPRNGERGFTLIELLVVMLIIGVLAAIALPNFLNQRSKAQDSEAKSTARVAATALEVYFQEHDSYGGADADALALIESSLGRARNLVVEGDADSYTLSVDSASGDSGGGPFIVEHSVTDTVRTCTTPARGGCPVSGEW